MIQCVYYFHILFYNSTATTKIYTLSLHDALPICSGRRTSTAFIRVRTSSGSSLEPWPACRARAPRGSRYRRNRTPRAPRPRSEEHTSELQSRRDLVCRLLLEKKNKYLQKCLSRR